MKFKDLEHYDTLFLTKNFIGNLFIIDRKKQETLLNEAYQYWLKGYHQSLLIHGDPLCGKSTFIETISKKYFNRNTINLIPNHWAEVDGRKFNTTTDLKQALTQIKNNSIRSSRKVLIIDGIELWRDDNIKSFLENIRSLLNFIEDQADQIFTIITTNNLLLDFLNGRFDFDRYFSYKVDLSKAETLEIFKALTLRHETAHKTLVNKDSQQIHAKKFDQILSKLIKKHNHNIGETLQAWTFNTLTLDEYHIMHNEEADQLPNFFTTDELIILKFISIFTKIDQKSLNKLFNFQTTKNQNLPLKRLLNLKVLIKDFENSISINSVLVNDILKILKQKSMY